MSKSLLTKTTLIFLLIIMCMTFISPVFAQEMQSNEFDKTNVYDDLTSANDFDIRNYPYKDNASFQLINFVEYCYSYIANNQSNYSLYIYIYNPSGKAINTKSRANNIQMATEFDSEGSPIKYEKMTLDFLSVSEEGGFENLFYKFKVREAQKLLTLYNGKFERNYFVSSVELLEDKSTNATDVNIGTQFIFTGYSKGFGANETSSSSLTSIKKDIDVVEIDLTGENSDGIDKRTVWRTQSSSLGKYYQNQVNSVFFAIDKNILEKYGYKLQKIEAEWFEYKTVPAVVVSDQTVYQGLSKYVGEYTGDGDAIGNDHDKSKDYYLKSGYYTTEVYDHNHRYTWNAPLQAFDSPFLLSDYVEKNLPLLFNTKNTAVNDYILSSDTLSNYIYNYDKSFNKGVYETNSKTFSADLFMDEVDQGRVKGYNHRIFDIDNPDDFWDLKSYDTNKSWWDKFKDYGFGQIVTDDDYLDIRPIQHVTREDMAQSNISERLQVGESDVEDLQNLFSNAQAKQQEVFIFRYAATDYYAEDIQVFDMNKRRNINGIAEVRQSTQFIDFDIITFTFNKDEKLTVIPVVSNPIDHISNLTPPIAPEYSPENILKYVLWAVIAIIGLVLVITFLPFVIKLLIYILMLPFKLIKLIIDLISNQFK